MKKLFVSLTVALVVMGSAIYPSFAQSKKRTVDVRISSDFMVDTTLIKKGDYRARVDFETGEMTLMDRGDVVAMVKGEIVEREMKSPHTAVSFKDTESGRKLVGLMMAGEKRALVLNNASKATTTTEEQ